MCFLLPWLGFVIMVIKAAIVHHIIEQQQQWLHCCHCYCCCQQLLPLPLECHSNTDQGTGGPGHKDILSNLLDSGGGAPMLPTQCPHASPAPNSGTSRSTCHSHHSTVAMIESMLLPPSGNRFPCFDMEFLFLESTFSGVDTIFICVFDHGVHVLHHRHKFFVSDLHISDSWPRHRPHISWWNHYIFHDCLHVTR